MLCFCRFQKKTSRERLETCGAEEHNEDPSHHEKGVSLHLHIYMHMYSYCCFVFAGLKKKGKRKKKKAVRIRKSKNGVSTKDDGEATMTEEFRSCLAEDDEVNTEREATYVICCDFCFMFYGISNFVLFLQEKAKAEQRKQQRSKAASTKDDGDATLTEELQSCLAEDNEVDTNREATYASCCDFYFMFL